MSIYTFYLKFSKLPKIEKYLINYAKARYINTFVKKGKSIKLHLGCGNVYLKNYLNIDVRPLKNVDIVADITSLPFIPDSSVDEIYTCHTFEHISHQKSMKVLEEWFRILKCEGKIIISVPDFEYIINIYKKTGNNIWNIKSVLMGEQDYPEDSHYSVFNYNFFEQILSHTGFKNIRRLSRSEKITNKDWSFRKIKVPTGEEFPISLNISAEK
jgi:predicted SAM-dependent methyltransferase